MKDNLLQDAELAALTPDELATTQGGWQWWDNFVQSCADAYRTYVRVDGGGLFF